MVAKKNSKNVSGKKPKKVSGKKMVSSKKVQKDVVMKSIKSKDERNVKLVKDDSLIWKIATVILGLALVGVIVLGNIPLTGGEDTDALNDTDISQKMNVDIVAENVKTYIEDKLLQEGMSADVVETSESNGVYVVIVSVDSGIGEGQNVTSYVTLDGKYFFPSGLDMITVEEDTPVDDPVVEDDTTDDEVKVEDDSGNAVGLDKVDRPNVELFVMSHCPYGTQAEKGIIPAIEALGDTVDFTLRFVNYAMHAGKEVIEQTNQYCIQKEQNDKLIPYLKCFLDSGDSDACVAEVGVDKDKMDACYVIADNEFNITVNLEDRASWLSGRFPLYLVDGSLNEKYGIRGSPGFVLNGETLPVGRSPQNYLDAICSTFNDRPAACDAELSTQVYSPGFGYDTTASGSSEGECA